MSQISLQDRHAAILKRLREATFTLDVTDPFFIIEEALKLVYRDIMGNAVDNDEAIQNHALVGRHDSYCRMADWLAAPLIADKIGEEVTPIVSFMASAARHDVNRYVRDVWRSRLETGVWPPSTRHEIFIRRRLARSKLQNTKNSSAIAPHRSPMRQISTVIERLVRH